MAGSFNDNDDEITDINVTPFVDVVLVLLVIFMVTANYIVNESINMSLPKASTGETRIDEPANLAFVIDKNTNVFINGKPSSFAEIGNEVTKYKEENKDKPLQALISADADVSHGAVVKLLDEVRKNGIADFAINVEASE